MTKTPFDGEKRTARLHMMLSPSELDRINDWRFANRIGTQAEAVRQLCKIGLQSPSATERVMFDMLCENFEAWYGEEDSVKEEHADLIEKTEALIDSVKARFHGTEGKA